MKTFGRPNSARASEPSMFDLMTWNQPVNRNSETRDSFKVHHIQQKPEQQQQKQNLSKNELIQQLNQQQEKKLSKHFDQNQTKQYYHQENINEENIKNILNEKQIEDIKIKDTIVQKPKSMSKSKYEKENEKISQKNKINQWKQANKPPLPKKSVQQSLNLQNPIQQTVQKISQYQKPPLQNNQNIQNIKRLQKPPYQIDKKNINKFSRPQSAKGKITNEKLEQIQEKKEKEIEDPKWKRENFMQLMNDQKAKQNLLSKKINHVIPEDSNISDKINDFQLIELNPKHYKQVQNANEWLEKIPYAGKSKRDDLRPSMNDVLFGYK